MPSFDFFKQHPTLNFYHLWDFSSAPIRDPKISTDIVLSSIDPMVIFVELPCHPRRQISISFPGSIRNIFITSILFIKSLPKLVGTTQHSTTPIASIFLSSFPSESPFSSPQFFPSVIQVMPSFS
jgi:hypothetical protein